MKSIIIVAGAIGAGKTTILKKLINSLILDDYELISTDIYLTEFFLESDNTIDKSYSSASCFSKYMLNKCANKQKNIIWETVIAKETKIETIKRFKSIGYTITCFYVSVNNIDICIDRVKMRNKGSSYSVNEDRVVSRYYKSYDYYKNVVELSDNFILIDNSSVPTIKNYSIKDKKVLGGIINDL